MVAEKIPSFGQRILHTHTHTLAQKFDLLACIVEFTYVKIFIESWKSPLLNFPMVFHVKRAKKFVKLRCGWHLFKNSHNLVWYS